MPTLSASKNQGSRAGTRDIYHIQGSPARAPGTSSLCRFSPRLASPRPLGTACRIVKKASNDGPHRRLAAITGICASGITRSHNYRNYEIW